MIRIPQLERDEEFERIYRKYIEADFIAAITGYGSDTSAVNDNKKPFVPTQINTQTK